MAQDNIGKPGLFIDQAVYLFALVKAIVKVIPGGAQGVAEYLDGIAVSRSSKKRFWSKKSGAVISSAVMNQDCL